MEVHCVHQHTAPTHDASAQLILDKTENPPNWRSLEFLDEVTDRLAAAAKESLKDLQAVDQIGTGEAKVDRVASSRRIMVNGKFHWRLSSTKDPKLQALPEGFIDPMLKTITLARAANRSCGCTTTQPIRRVFIATAAPVGTCPASPDSDSKRRKACSRSTSPDAPATWRWASTNDRTRRARAELADRLYAGMEGLRRFDPTGPIGPLEWRSVEVLFTPRSDGKYDRAKCLAIAGDAKAEPRVRARAAMRIACAEWLKRPIVLGALRIGDIHIIHLPASQ